MSWYSKQIAKELRKYKYYLPELKTKDESEYIISRLTNEDWHVSTEIDVDKHLVYVTTSHLNQPIVVAQALRSLDYKVLMIDEHQRKSQIRR